MHTNTFTRIHSHEYMHTNTCTRITCKRITCAHKHGSVCAPVVSSLWCACARDFVRFVCIYMSAHVRVCECGCGRRCVDSGVSVYYTGWRPYHYCLCCCFLLLLLRLFSCQWLLLPNRVSISYRIALFRCRKQCRFLAGICVSAPACLPLCIWTVFGLSPDQNGLPPSILDFQLNDGRMKHTQNTHTHRGRRRRKGKRFTARKECFWVSFFYFHLFDLSLSFFFPQPAKGEKIYSSQGMFLGIFLSPWIEGHSVERAHMYGSFHKKAPHYLRHLWLDFGGSFVWMLWKDPHNRDLLLHFMDRSTRKHVVERSIY